jgi:hypothetical protein
MKSENTSDFAFDMALPQVVDDLANDPTRRVTERIGYDRLATEESLVVDSRFALTPAQVVETKLTRVLKEATMPVSHLQMRGLLRNR